MANGQRELGCVHPGADGGQPFGPQIPLREPAHGLGPGVAFQGLGRTGSQSRAEDGRPEDGHHSMRPRRTLHRCPDLVQTELQARPGAGSRVS